MTYKVSSGTLSLYSFTRYNIVFWVRVINYLESHSHFDFKFYLKLAFHTRLQFSSFESSKPCLELHGPEILKLIVNEWFKQKLTRLWWSVSRICNAHGHTRWHRPKHGRTTRKQRMYAHHPESLGGSAVSVAACGQRGREFDASLCSSCRMSSYQLW